MNTPQWSSPAIMGAAVGAIATVIIGFSWGGWITSSKAEVAAADRAYEEVLSALLPICLNLSSKDPELTAKLELFKLATEYKRTDMLMAEGWATMPGSTDPNRSLARRCAAELVG